MPSDLAIDTKDVLVQVRDRCGVDLPFSKGLVATSIHATGLETGQAHAIAADIGISSICQSFAVFRTNFDV
jgi:2-phosphoglycerate kinase